MRAESMSGVVWEIRARKASQATPSKKPPMDPSSPGHVRRIDLLARIEVAMEFSRGNKTN